MNFLLGKKVEQGQKFLQNGTRIPVTKVLVTGNVVVGVKTKEKHLYSALQIGFGIRKSKKSNAKKSPYLFLREVKLADEETATLPKVGEALKASVVFKPGDIIDVSGISKGKGYAGVVKRHHFKGGPKTHGQSDRQRAPGAIGSTTTPGRVYRGKRMAGKMGHENTTVKNLLIANVTDEYILVKGLVPGGRNNLLMLKKVGEDKEFIPLFREIKETASNAAKVETKTSEMKKEEAANAS